MEASGFVPQDKVIHCWRMIEEMLSGQRCNHFVLSIVRLVVVGNFQVENIKTQAWSYSSLHTNWRHIYL